MFRKIIFLGLVYLLLSGSHGLKLLCVLVQHSVLNGLSVVLALTAISCLVLSRQQWAAEEVVCTEGELQIWARALRFRWLNEAMPWQQIRRIDAVLESGRREFDPDDDFFADRVISLRASGGQNVVIKLNSLAPQKQLQLLSNLDKWSLSKVRSESIEWLMRNAPKSIDTTSGVFSLTRIWEEDLAKAGLGATVYVPLQPGQLVDREKYRITKFLAAGGQAATYLAVDKDNRTVVIKEFYWLDQLDMQQKADELFVREFLILRQIDHKRIAKVLGWFKENNRSYLVLEHLAFDNARRRVRLCGAMTSGQTIEIGLQLASLLKYLHAFSPPILHRDLSPDNLIIDHDACVYLIDFGACSEAFSQVTGTAIGKQAYVAPEQFRGKAVQASDIYGVGCTLYFLLTGQDPVPFSVSHPSFINPTVSTPLDRLIARCTVQNWPDRIVDAEDLQKELMATSGMR